ncbi:hypothetical protein [Yoonia sp.]
MIIRDAGWGLATKPRRTPSNGNTDFGGGYHRTDGMARKAALAAKVPIYA